MDPQPQKLETLGLDARKCRSCCEAAYIRAAITYEQLASEILDAVAFSPTSDAGPIAFVAPGVVLPEVGPNPITQPRIVRLAPGTAVVPGIVVLIGGAVLAGIARTTGAVETAGLMVNALTAVRTTQVAREFCEKCVRSKVWSQDAPRATVPLLNGGNYHPRQ